MVFFFFILYMLSFFYLVYKKPNSFQMMKIFSFFIFFFLMIIFFNVWPMSVDFFFYTFHLLFFNFSFFLDFFSIFFFFLLLSISSFILFYSYWYFSEEVSMKLFFFYMSFFIFFMFILVSSGSIFMVLLSWESVSVMSYLLISWWFGRSEATLSATQAVLYNRLSDFCFFLSIFSLLFLSFSSDLFLKYSFFSPLFTFLLIFSIISKSSQFLFHPWLPNAMESPTPVSSLLHSSTMVVASVFLVIRLLPFFSNFSIIILSFFSSLTMLLSALNSVGGKDLKKIIAHSTTSQLSFMILTAVVTSQFFSFFLLFLHAFFKSCLFLSSSVLIHSMNNNQQVELSTGGFLPNKFTFSVFMLSSFSLMSIPFFSSFFSKDLIIENIWSSVFNRFLSFIFIFSSILTVCYSFSLLFSPFFFFFLSFSKFFKIELMSLMVSWLIVISISSVYLSGLMINFFFLFLSEEFLSFFSKIIPMFILFSGSLVFFSSSFFDRSRFLNLYFFNLLFHRLFSFIPLMAVMNYKFFEFKVFEFFLGKLNPPLFFFKFFFYSISLGKFFLMIFFLSFFFILLVWGSFF